MMVQYVQHFELNFVKMAAEVFFIMFLIFLVHIVDDMPNADAMPIADDAPRSYLDSFITHVRKNSSCR